MASQWKRKGKNIGGGGGGGGGRAGLIVSYMQHYLFSKENSHISQYIRIEVSKLIHFSINSFRMSHMSTIGKYQWFMTSLVQK